MYPLSLSTVPNWQDWRGMWVPVTVDTLCPHCNRIVNLPLRDFSHDSLRKTVMASARCAACTKDSYFWIIEPGNAKDTSQRGCISFCIYPKQREAKKPILDLNKIQQPMLASAYQETLDAYNAGFWTACASSCRRTLEGLVMTILGDEYSKESLYQQLKSLPDKVNLSEPFMLLAENLRKGGNIASHFDFEKKPNQPVAEAMIDLLDYIIEYVFVLKDKADELEKRLDQLGK